MGKDNSNLFKTFPHFIQVTRQPDGLLRAKTNTHLLENVEDNDHGLMHICFPYCGKGIDIELDVEDEGLRLRITKMLERYTNMYVFLEDEHPILYNLYHNYMLMYRRPERFFSFHTLKDCAKGRDILFLGAGPSLTKNIDKVRKIIDSNRAVVVAGGSALRVLCKHNIVPHLALAFDPRHSEKTVVFDHLTDEWLEKVTMITTPGLYHQCMTRVGKAIVGTTSALVELGGWLEPDELLVNEGRVGVATMFPHIAKIMGCSRLFYLGVDLMFGSSGNRYEDDDKQKMTDIADYFQFKSCHTRVAWVRESEDILSTVADMPYKFYSCSKNSMLMRMKGGEYKPLKELKKKGKPIELTYIPKTETLEKIKEKFTQLHTELDQMDYRLGWQKPGMMQTKAYNYLLNSYDVVQQFREVRTGDYNYTLMKHVIRNNKRWLAQSLGIIDPERRYDCTEEDLHNEANK